MLNLNAGQRHGAIAIGIAFGLTVIAGIALSFLALSWETTAIIGTAVVLFLLISPFLAYGIYTFAKASQEEELAEEMTVPRQLLDILRENGSGNISDLAIDLAVPSLKPIIADLSRLELFNGIVEWDTGIITLVDPAVMTSIENCKHCGKAIKINRGINVCPHCATEYHHY